MINIIRRLMNVEIKSPIDAGTGGVDVNIVGQDLTQDIEVVGPIDTTTGGVEAVILGPVDSTTGAVKSISYPHNEIHGARTFSVHEYSTALTASNQLNVCFTTDDSTRWEHMTVSVSCTFAAIFQILEAPTVTAATGSQYTPVQHQRNSDITSLAWDLEATPVQNSVSVGATITADGTEIFGGALGAGKSFGGVISDSGSRNEYVLKQNTTYAFRLLRTADAGSAIATMHLTWYEHINR